MLNNKVVLITGATSGIGALLAAKLAKLGAYVVITGRNQQRLAEVSKSLGSNGSYYTMDVNNEQHIIDVYEQIISKYGKIDIVINNAGYGKFLAIEDCSTDEYAHMMDTNYMGVVRSTKCALTYMEKAQSGHIVNIASLAGMIGSAKSTAYAATKHAVLGFTNSLRMELRGRNSKVIISAVNPGPIRTPFFEQADPEGTYIKNISWLLMEPDYVVKRIIKLLLSQRAELNLPWYAGVGLRLYNVCPRFIDRLAGKWLNQK